MHHHSSATEKKPKTFWGVLWDIAFFFFYPIITLFALLFVGVVYVFSSLSHFFSSFSGSKEESAEEVKQPEWEPLVQCRTFAVEHLLVEEIMFGPAYYSLRTKPAQPHDWNKCYFGDFSLPCFGGTLLQRWNTTVPKDLPDFDLVFLNGETGQLHTLRTIKAFSWQAEVLNEDTVLLKWLNGSESGEIEIHRQDVLDRSTLIAD